MEPKLAGAPAWTHSKEAGMGKTQSPAGQQPTSLWRKIWRRARILVAGLALTGATWSMVWAAPPPTVAQTLAFTPRQEGVPYTTPAPGAEANCKVEGIKGAGGKGSGWILRDGSGQPLRVFFDSNDDGKVDVWSYYKDGVEVYREIDSNYSGKPDQYRWLNSAGSRWGIDEGRTGKVTTWKSISAEEVAQEILAAVATKDFARFQAVLVSDAELKALDLPGDVAGKMREKVKNARTRFDETVAKLTKISPKANFIHLETVAPQTVPADQLGSRQDLVKHARGTILYEVGGTNDWLQTGEMIQVAGGWRVVDAPTPGAVPPELLVGTRPAGTSLDQNPKLLKLIEDLSKLDKLAPASMSGADARVTTHHLSRADLLEKIVGEVKPEEREPWIRQVADSLSTAAQASPANETVAMGRLQSLVKQITQALPGSNLAAYATFREMQADYSQKILKADKFEKVQQEWADSLARFVQAYPKSDDTPDALLQLGMVNEFLTTSDRNREVEAKNWYSQVVKNFPSKPQASKAAGAIRRLELEGQPIKLAGPQLQDLSTPFDLDQMRGKVVVVYYWASWNGQCANDFSKLKTLSLAFASKGVDVLTVNLDGTAEEARAFLARNPAPGTHLYQAGGLEGKLATDYGVMVLPSIFLVSKEGKVLSRNLHINSVEDELKKHLK
jgi:thiol-disulfide isomerase/thioredoxin